MLYQKKLHDVENRERNCHLHLMEHFITLCCNKGRNGKLTDRNFVFWNIAFITENIPWLFVHHRHIT